MDFDAFRSAFKKLLGCRKRVSSPSLPTPSSSRTLTPKNLKALLNTNALKAVGGWKADQRGPGGVSGGAWALLRFPNFPPPRYLNPRNPAASVSRVGRQVLISSWAEKKEPEVDFFGGVG